MPLGLGPILDQIVTVLLLIAAAIGGLHLYKKYERPPQPAQVQAAPNAAPAKTASSAEEILNERYARGGMDRAHYLEMLQNLKAQSSEVSKGSGILSTEGIVRERYARGEINGSDFQQTMDDLRNTRQ